MEAAVCGGMVCAFTCGLFPGFIQSAPYGGERCLSCRSDGDSSRKPGDGACSTAVCGARGAWRAAAACGRRGGSGTAGAGGGASGAEAESAGSNMDSAAIEAVSKKLSAKGSFVSVPAW